MKIAAFQFKGSGSIADNFTAIRRGILSAAEQNVRFLLTQECALCGYPPIETKAVTKIDFDELAEAELELAHLAVQQSMFVALGTILRDGGAYHNAIRLLSPSGTSLPPYSKRALWGWDRENFTPGSAMGIYTIDSIRVGVRICFEVRFPEYFRELFREHVDLACVSFCDVSPEPNPVRYELIQAHLMTRAVENALFVLSANSMSGHSSAPTCLIDPDGAVLSIAPPNQEHLLTFDYQKPDANFGREGRIRLSRELLDSL
jgi:predicted amidohydrolase